jgi:hypothetical protein
MLPFPSCHGCFSHLWNSFPNCDRRCYISKELEYLEGVDTEETMALRLEAEEIETAREARHDREARERAQREEIRREERAHKSACEGRHCSCESSGRKVYLANGPGWPHVAEKCKGCGGFVSWIPDSYLARMGNRHIVEE